MSSGSLSPQQGLYDPTFEHDACGVGFVVDMQGRKSHEIIQNGIKILENLAHRGACGCDPQTGDGAGILIQMPDAFFRKELDKIGLDLPDLGDYSAGLVFLPTSLEDRNIIEESYRQRLDFSGPVNRIGIRFHGDKLCLERFRCQISSADTGSVHQIQGS